MTGSAQKWQEGVGIALTLALWKPNLQTNANGMKIVIGVALALLFILLAFAILRVLDIRADPEGRPIVASFQRWSDANPEKVYRLQPFGATMLEYREGGGYRLPFHVEAGNMFGTDDYFPFFIADVTKSRLPEAR